MFFKEQLRNNLLLDDGGCCHSHRRGHLLDISIYPATRNMHGVNLIWSIFYTSKGNTMNKVILILSLLAFNTLTVAAEQYQQQYQSGGGQQHQEQYQQQGQVQGNRGNRGYNGNQGNRGYNQGYRGHGNKQKHGKKYYRGYGYTYGNRYNGGYGYQGHSGTSIRLPGVSVDVGR